MQRLGVRAVFFDAVGTLIHPDPPAPLVYAQTGERFGGRLTAEEIGPRFRAAYQRSEQWDRNHGWRTSEEREIERWRRIVGEVLDDVEDQESCFQELFTHFSHPHAWQPDPQAASVVEALAGRGLVLGVASNYDRRLRSVVAGLPELKAVQHLVISSEVGWRKPAPQFFATLRFGLALPAEQILFVGDDFDNDYEGGRAAGFRVVLFDPNGKGSEPAVPRLARLSEALSLL